MCLMSVNFGNFGFVDSIQKPLFPTWELNSDIFENIPLNMHILSKQVLPVFKICSTFMDSSKDFTNKTAIICQ
jgi:hypothetical protein